MVAFVVQKGKWKDGKFPTAEGLHYRTRQILFRTDTGEALRVNVKTHVEASLAFDKLKSGDGITGFTLLKPGIIDSESNFSNYHKGALF